MVIGIIDPASHIPSLKQLFPEAEYFSHEPDSFFTYSAAPHYTKEKIYKEYGFNFRTDWNAITSDNFHTLFIVLSVMDYYRTFPLSISTGYYKTYLNKPLPPRDDRDRMLDIIVDIVSNNKFKQVVLFDTYDYDYDPSIVDTRIKANYYFKRNYDMTKKYNSNVFPFPCMMFVKPCVLGMMLNKNTESTISRINLPMWAGSIYKHIDNNFVPQVIRDRKSIFNKIQDKLVVYSGLSEYEYRNKIKQYTILVDLLGVGDPNKRIFEGFSSGTLVMTMSCDLNWGFSDGDDFHPDTKFRTAEEYFTKVDRLVFDSQHYIKCLNIQNTLVNKYFTQYALSTYILSSIDSIAF